MTMVYHGWDASQLSKKSLLLVERGEVDHLARSHLVWNMRLSGLEVVRRSASYLRSELHHMKYAAA